MARLATSGGRRNDWKSARAGVDLAAVVADLLGPAPGRRGERGRRLWWHCPFHRDPNPSFCVTPGRPWWRYFGCGEHGDAATLVMRLRKLSFPEAVAFLTGGSRSSVKMSRRSNPAPGPGTSPGPAQMTREAAAALVDEAVARLWSAEGESHLAYLTGRRGLTPDTIRAARLGFTPPLELPARPRGIVIPWFSGQDLIKIMIRQPTSYQPKYLEIYRDRDRHPGIYPGHAVIRPGAPLIIDEGEFDALLLGQEIGDLAAVVTLGSASDHPRPEALGRLLCAVPWFIGTDSDDAGDRAAASWPRPARRIAPPTPFKDWSEARVGGVNLREWWEAAFARETFLLGLQSRGLRLDDLLVYPRIAVRTITGRVMYTEPAIQSDVKKIERPTRLTPVVEGRLFIKADYGQIEPRILLSIQQRKGLIGWDAGEDLYRTLADNQVDRETAKIIVNTIINGGRPPSEKGERLSEFIRAIDIYRAELTAEARAHGFVRTLAGRAIPLASHEKNFAGKALNRVIQGTAADIFNAAALRVDQAIRANGMPAAVAFLLYDELWVEVDPAVMSEATELVRSEMQAAALALGVTIPVRFESEALAGAEDQAERPDRDEEFEERAAILEFDGGLDRIEAEQLARKLLA